IQSAASAAAGAIGVALATVPWYSSIAQPSDADARASVTSARSNEHVGSQAEDEIRPFRVDIPQPALDDLRTRLLATRWPTKELVEDRSQGVQLTPLRELARYWTTEYDWRKAEAK